MAIKVISIHNAPQNYIRKFLPREISAMCKSYRHRNIIQLFESFATPERVFLVLELCHGGTLLDKIKVMSETPMKAMTEITARPIMIGIVQGVDYLHSLSITHRDLKPENIMLTRDETPKIIDFGFARSFTNEVYTMRTLCGSRAYCSPEFLRNRGYFARQHDVWALGVILYVMLNGSLPYSGKTSAEVHSSIQKNRPLRQKNHRVVLSEASMNLIRKTQNVIPRLRVTTKQMLQHKWMIIDETLRKHMSKHESKWQNDTYEAKKLKMLGANWERSCFVKENITDKTILPHQALMGTGERIFSKKANLPVKIPVKTLEVEEVSQKQEKRKVSQMPQILSKCPSRPKTQQRNRVKRESQSQGSLRRPKTQPNNAILKHSSIYYRL